MWYLVLSRPTGPAEERRPFLGDHLAWQKEQHAKANVLFSGPTSDRQIGIYVVRASSLDEAQQITDTDPYHERGLRAYEMHEWNVNEIMGAGFHD
jgi:uncharacterized protein YciI